MKYRDDWVWLVETGENLVDWGGNTGETAVETWLDWGGNMVGLGWKITVIKVPKLLWILFAGFIRHFLFSRVGLF